MNETMQSTGRLKSLDVLRGADMLFIMGFAALVIAFCDAVGLPRTHWLPANMVHTAWNGLTHHDTIFPLFLFIAGVSWPFSCARQLARGDAKGRIALRCVKRAMILFALGVVYTGFLGDFSRYRIGTVLGRIGLAWAISAGLYLCCGWRRRVAIAAALLIGYWIVSLSFVAPDHPGADPLSAEGCISGWIDRTFIPGVMNGPRGVRMDNQSALGLLPAIVTAMLGVFAGEIVRGGQASGERKTISLLAIGAGLVGIGLLVAHGFGSWSMPVNKILWSSSFVLVVGGISFVAFAAFYYLIDVRGWWRRTLFFEVIGRNSITIYLAQALIPVSVIAHNLFGGAAALLPSAWGEVLLKVGYVVLCWSFLYFLHRNRIYLKV